MERLNDKQVRKIIEVSKHFGEFVDGETLFDVIHMQYALLFTTVSVSLQVGQQDASEVKSRLRPIMNSIHEQLLERFMKDNEIDTLH